MTTHIFSSILLVVFSVAATIGAYWSMKRGLMYSTVTAVVTSMLVLALVNALHLIDEIYPFGLEQNHLDHIGYILAYAVFLWLVIKAKQVKVQ